MTGTSEKSGKPMETNEIHDVEFLEFENFSKFYEQFSLTIKETVGASTKISLKQNELDYYLTCPAFKNFLQTQNERCLNIISSFLKQQRIKKTNINSSKLEDDERMDLLIDSNDQMIEKLGIQLDEIQGLRKKTETELKLKETPLQVTSRNINTSWNKDMGMVVNKTLLQNANQRSNNETKNVTSYNNHDLKKGVMIKPQKVFKDKLDNSYLPFLPKLRKKPNQLIPLPDIYNQLDHEKFELSKEVFEKNPELLDNPYQHEIEQIQINDLNFESEIKIQQPLLLENTPMKYIDEVDDLIWLVDYLSKNNRSKIKEIAVDLEHHNYRSFLGFTCLMQISTRFDDFIVDTIKLRSEMHRLNEIFTDWTLIKVMHGADFDIEWLQKDFGIYVVNMFDTGQASRILQYPHFSLSYLLQKFCQINAQKQYQLADWRQRPLSEPMLKYAREDTHYLLYIYDNIRDDLIKFQSKQQLNKSELSIHFSHVLEKSKIICKKTYKKPLFYTKGFLNLCQHNSHLNSKQTKALRDLYEWRDKTARESDESCEYVLKNHQLLKIAELLPREIYGILALCNPLSSILETNVHEVLEVIKKAREFSGTMTSITSLIESENTANQKKTVTKIESQSKSVLESIVHLTTYDPNSIINCAHDFPQDRDDQMDILQQQDATVNLSDLLVKPNIVDDNMPNNLVKEATSTLTNLFNKEFHVNLEENSLEKVKQNKKLKKIEEKVKTIKNEIEHPFSMFLPSEFRKTNNLDTSIKKWILLKAKKIESVEPSIQSSVTQTKIEKESTEEFMIPLKKQYRLEKFTSGEKKTKKRANKIDFTDAIIEYNKSKIARVNALGGEDDRNLINENQNDDIDKTIEIQQKKLDNLVQDKIRSNLSILSKESNNPKNSFASNSEHLDKNQETIYSYDVEAMNKLFAKPEKTRDEFDPASKIGNSRHKKVNKRRMTNSVTRVKNNHSLTYKKEQPNNMGGTNSKT